MPFVFRVSGGSGVTVLVFLHSLQTDINVSKIGQRHCLYRGKEKKNTRRVPHAPQVRHPITSTRMREWIPAAMARSW